MVTRSWQAFLISPLRRLRHLIAVVRYSIEHSQLPLLHHTCDLEQHPARCQIVVQSRRAHKSTFYKRKSGLFKKAYELGILTDTRVHVFIECKESGRIDHAFIPSLQEKRPNYHAIPESSIVGPELFSDSVSTESREEVHTPSVLPIAEAPRSLMNVNPLHELDLQLCPRAPDSHNLYDGGIERVSSHTCNPDEFFWRELCWKYRCRLWTMAITLGTVVEPFARLDNLWKCNILR